MNYARLAFSEAVKNLQEINGSRKTYERVEKHKVVEGLSENEIDFIAERDNFYMATIGENGYPYIQHRGGPAGFIKVIDSKTIGLVDFSGNKQYISVGNLATHPQVALIMVSYPQQARLKIYGDVRIVDLNEAPELFQQLDPSDYKHTAERIFIFDIKAYDWNCPQHITPRYTREEIETALKPQKEYIDALERENAELKALLKK